MSKLTLRDYTVAEFRGSFPQIATDERVDIAALTTGDDDPFFVTLPIARAGEVSKNGLVYDEQLVSAIAEQAVGKGGIMGHLKDEERDTAFPIEDADWVGVLRQGETLWGKAYIPPGEAREYIRRLKARGGRLATSIYGPYQDQLPGEAEGSYRIRGLRLEQLDLAPADRAALNLGGRFQVTAEIDNNNEPEEQPMATKEEVIAELTAADLPETLREQIVSDYQESNQQEAIIAELEQERDDAQALVEALREQVQAYRVQEFDSALDNQVAEFIDWNVEGDEAEKRVNALRNTLRRQILAELGDERDPDHVAEVAAEVWEEIKPLAETVKSALAGPPAFVPGRSNGKRPKLEVTEEATAQARSRMGL